jgi:hypothetical protein
LVAGFVACAKQAFPELKWKALFDKVESSGHLYPYHDEVHGKGIPQAQALFGERYFSEVHFDFEVDGEEIKILLQETFKEQDYPMNRTIPFVYWKICDEKGRVKRFALVLPEGKTGARIPLHLLEKTDQLVVHYRGSTKEYSANDKN